MKINTCATLVFFALVSNSSAQSSDIDKQYFASLFNEPGKAQSEFAIIANRFPLLSAYSLALFTEKSCGTQPPSENLFKAAGGNPVLETADGKRAFLVAGVIATLKYPTALQKESFCKSAKELVAKAEESVKNY